MRCSAQEYELAVLITGRIVQRLSVVAVSGSLWSRCMAHISTLEAKARTQHGAATAAQAPNSATNVSQIIRPFTVDLAVTRITSGTVAAAVDKADPVTPGSTHLCRSTRPVSEATLVVPVFSSINQWGALPFPLHRLTPHSLSRRARDLLAGHLGAHRHLPVDTTQTTEPVTPEPNTMLERPVYSRADHQRAWARRRADHTDLAGLDDLLKEVDAKAKDLDTRTAAILLGHSDRHGPGRQE